MRLRSSWRVGQSPCPAGKGSITHIKSHEDIVLLLITNCKLSLRLLVLLGELLQLAGGVVLHHRVAELDVGLGVFVTGLDDISSATGSTEKYVGRVKYA